MIKRIVLFFLFIVSYKTIYSNIIVKGKVYDENNKPIFAVNVYPNKKIETGTTTDFDGNFIISVDSLKNDSLVFSYIGYETKSIKITNNYLKVTLKEIASELAQVIINYTDPISEQFSITKMDMLKDVYLNPMAQGDPLKAISLLATSTNPNETAQVELRGSNSDRSSVVLNGVPLANPVRASSLNNQGFFSLFNPEIIEKQYVYAGNAPLTFGNSTAGLVEIETKKKLKKNKLQISLSLASAGFMLSRKTKEKKSFVQIYGNYQFSDFYVGIQEKHLPNIKNFTTLDGGINIHGKIGKKINYNSYNYFIDEQFNGKNIEEFTHVDNLKTSRSRFFSVNNFNIFGKKGILLLNNGINVDTKNYSFGNRVSNVNHKSIYNSLNYKWLVIDNTDIQFGLSYEYNNFVFNDSVPKFYFALSPLLPNNFVKNKAKNNNLELYFYNLWNINNLLSFSSGIRSNIPINNQEKYTSWQLNLKIKPNNYNYFLIGGGKYYNYSIPNYFLKSINLLSSSQFSVDYKFKKSRTEINSAFYYKEESGSSFHNRSFFTIDKTNTYGFEVSINREFFKYFNISLSNSFINQKITVNGNTYNSKNDFLYFVKSFVRYNNQKYVNLSLVFQTRPGNFYTSIIGSKTTNITNFNEPIFSNKINNKQYGNYNRFDLYISKFIPINNNSIVLFFSINNLFNIKNQRLVQYNKNYSEKHFNYYQLRNIYFGVVYNFL